MTRTVYNELNRAGYDALYDSIKTFREEKVVYPEQFRLISYASKAIRGAIYRQEELEKLSDSQHIRPTSWDDHSTWLSTTAEASPPAGARAKHNGAPFLAVDDATTNPPYMAFIEQQDEDILEQRLQAIFAGLTPDQQHAFIEIGTQIIAAEQTVDQESPESPQKGAKKRSQPALLIEDQIAVAGSLFALVYTAFDTKEQLFQSFCVLPTTPDEADYFESALHVPGTDMAAWTTHVRHLQVTLRDPKDVTGAGCFSPAMVILACG